MRSDRLAIVAATPVCAAGLYFLVAGTVDVSELIACIPVVLLGCFYARSLRRAASLPMRFQRPALLALARAAGAVVPDSVRVGGALLGAVRRRPAGSAGVVMDQPFCYGGGDPADAGRRAVVVTALSLAPNGFVLGMEDGGDLVLHQLRPKPASPDREWPS